MFGRSWVQTALGTPGLSECFEVDGCWKKVVVCAEEASRKIKRGAILPEKRAVIGRKHCGGGGPGACSPGKF